MIDHGDQLREAFETHENLAPDPAAVYARVQELSVKHKRRRRGAQVASGTVLAAGLLAGGIFIPGLLPEKAENSTFAISPGAAPSATPAATPSSEAPSEEELQKAWDAYFQAGYDYDDAVKLAKLWKSTDEPGMVKAEAGRRLLAGETLPFAATPDDPEPEDGGISPADQKMRDAYFAAGYDWDDAVKLGKLWKVDADQAKVEAGKRLLDGKKLPFKPDPANVEEQKESQRVNAFFRAGYDYDDAAKLAKLWKLSDPYQGKVEGGKRLLAGKKLPFQP